MTEEGKEKEVIADLTADPNEQLNKDAATAIAKAVKKTDAEQLLQEMAKVIQQNELSLRCKISLTKPTQR